MPELKGVSPNYGNWVSAKLIYTPGAIAFIFLGLSIVVMPVLIIGTVLFFIPFIYFAYAHHKFSSRGGDIQAKIQNLLVGYLDWKGQGKVLDIGCGNGPLTIKIAKKFPRAQITGIDYWGKAWEYSKSLCESNAEIEGVKERVIFQKASASLLPYNDASFDAAISNLTFHEVRDAKNKRLLIKEALRVVRKGGSFAFQDLFQWKHMYGEVNELIDTIKSWGIESVEFINTCDSEFIPRALKLPFMLGTMGILFGRK